jgi:hypothetical protein
MRSPPVVIGQRRIGRNRRVTCQIVESSVGACLALHRSMEDVLARIWGDLGGRIGGPLSFRLILQPIVATILAVKAGLQDARDHRPAYFWAILANPDERRGLLQQGWKAVAKVFVLAIVIDLAYEIMVFHWVYPGELLIIAFLLACVPYLLVRGPVNRIMSATREGRHV